MYKGHFKYFTLNIAFFSRLPLNLCTHEHLTIKLFPLYLFLHILSRIILEIFFFFWFFSSVFPPPVGVLETIIPAKTVTLRWFVIRSFIPLHHDTRYWISLDPLLWFLAINFLPLSGIWSSKTLMISKRPGRWTVFEERYRSISNYCGVLSVSLLNTERENCFS